MPTLIHSFDYTYAAPAGGQRPRGTKYRTGWRLHYIHRLGWLILLLQGWG